MQSIEFKIKEGKKNTLGLICLNHPKQINAMNASMCQLLYDQLKTWEKQPHIKAVIIQGAGNKGFCSGGDLRFIYEKRHDQAAILALFQYEYQLNYLIANYKKPFISLIHGITWGGGVGQAIYAKCRIADPSLSFAMPEVNIGFHPDIGSSYFLSRCPHFLGYYLALTGLPINAVLAKQLGFIDFIIKREYFNQLIDLWADEASIKGHDLSPFYTQLKSLETNHLPQDPLAEKKAIIRNCFSQPSVQSIVDALSKPSKPSKWIEDTLYHLKKLPIISLEVTLAQLKRGKRLNLLSCLKMEYLITQHFIKQSNFFEGIRTTLIDKNKSPTWAIFNTTDKTQIDHYFTPNFKKQLFYP